MRKGARFLAYEILKQFNNKTKLDSLIDKVFTKYNPDYLVRSRCRVIVSDVIRLLGRIDLIIKIVSGKNQKQISRPMQSILRIGFYEILIDDLSPNYATVDSLVNLAKSISNRKSAGFINAVLRKLVRKNNNNLDWINSLSNHSEWNSMPDWIQRRWKKNLGSEGFIKMIENVNENPPSFIRIEQKGKIIEQIINKNKFYSDELIALLKISLLNYFSAALLMPYEDFLKSAKKYKYDIEILMHHYAASFEQNAHRLTNLQRPGSEGVPFHFLKTDIAGNVSKRFSLSGIHIPRHGGSCPRWNVYIAFLNPGKIHPQISRMPDGKVYFCIARAFEKGIEKHGMPKSFVSIGLGCDIQYAKELTYSEGMDLQNKNLETPIGISCRICPRINCQQRAFPPIDKDLKLDINYRGTSPYVTV